MSALPCTVYVVSGSIGAMGEQLARTVLAQYEGADVPVEIISRVYLPEQLQTVIQLAQKNNGLIIHTLVDPTLRQTMIDLARKQDIPAIDVVGPLLDKLSFMLGQEPVGKPGMYRQLHDSYFKRIEAIEFTMAHDDGMNFDKWHNAEIILTGVSRVGKTPLSLYLSMLGWKVANVPLVMGIPPRPALFELDRRRVVGLTIDPTQLLYHRRHRQKRLGIAPDSDYVNPQTLYAEVKEARKIFRRGGFRVIDVTNKPIETSADQVISLINRQLSDPHL